MTEKPLRPIGEILEDPNIDDKREMAILQEMVDDGSIWGLEGHIGHLAMDLLEADILQFPEERTYDYWKNPIPTRAEWAIRKRTMPTESPRGVVQKMITRRAKVNVPLIQKEPVILQELPVITSQEIPISDKDAIIKKVEEITKEKKHVKERLKA